MRKVKSVSAQRVGHRPSLSDREIKFRRRQENTLFANVSKEVNSMSNIKRAKILAQRDALVKQFLFLAPNAREEFSAKHKRIIISAELIKKAQKRV